MLYKSATILAALAGLVAADPSPLTPATANVGATCLVQWTEDTTGLWTDTTIDLMTGSNLAMVKVVNVATGVNTVTSSSTSWTCPDVSPNAPIYFYQFTLANGSSPTWTTRFTIASATGATTAATNQTQPNGDAIPWGTGVLAGSSSSGSSTTTRRASSTVSGTSTGSTSTSVVASSSTTDASSSASAATTSSVTSSSSTSFVTITSSATSSSSSSTSTSSSSSTSSASTTTTTSGSTVIKVSGALIGLVGAAMTLLA
ncbi:hypothetical protein MNV49_007738 [Pseudohyphozyma bogoriensis]|nr:hypothetical protein MNV49_007738 [Pseudohyphozyma bogoriensis]